MNYQGTNPLIAEFDKRHGGEFELVGDAYIYPDGAYRDRYPSGILMDRHYDERVQAKRVVMYWEARVERLTDEFNELKSFLRSQASAGLNSHIAGPVPDQTADLERLKTLQRDVRQSQKKLKEAREGLEQRRPADARRIDAESVRHKAAASERVAQIDAIKL